MIQSKVMTCHRCGRQFREGQHVMFHGLSIYHEIHIPHGDQFQYAIERPYASLNIKHLVCDSDE